MSIVPSTLTTLYQSAIPDTDDADNLLGDLLVHTFDLSLPEVFTKYYYNYENSEYESFTENSDFRLIPNHICEAYGVDNLSGINPILEEGQVAQYGNIAYTIYSEEREWKNGIDTSGISSVIVGNYYSNYVQEDFRLVSNNDLKRYTNIFITAESPTTLMNNIKHVPNYFRIEIEPDDEGQIYSALKSNKHLTEVFLLMKRKPSTLVTFTYTADTNERSIDLKTWDFDIIDNPESQADELIFEKKLYKGYLQSRIERVTSPQDGGSYYSTIINDNTNLDDIKKSEIIGYKIEKITRGVVVQTYYVDKSLVDLNDTQYKFDQQYTYRFSQIVIVFGVSGTDADNLDSLSPSTRIIEIPFKEIDFRAIVWPIESPHVKAYTKGNENHRVDFLIEDREGHFLIDTPDMVTVLDEDQTYLNKVLNSSFFNTIDNTVRYSSRAASGQYEMFKLDYKPKHYSDFSDGFLGTIGEANYMLSANFVDYIPYNKKMYYAFRSINHRGEPGNLSLVKEIELVQDADENILIQNDYDIEQSDKTTTKMDFRRFIRIVPEMEHLLFKSNIDAFSLNPNDIVLGPDSSTSLWEFDDQKKYFKLRLTNKTSGQKFDINLRFINKQSS